MEKECDEDSGKTVEIISKNAFVSPASSVTAAVIAKSRSRREDQPTLQELLQTV